MLLEKNVPSKDTEKMEQAVQELLISVGENPHREGLAKTPLRVATSLKFLTSGYHTTISDVVKDAIFETKSQGMVMQKHLEFYSLCEHHLLPFFGTINVAYLPDRRIIGLSKVGRIINLFSRRLQVQERLTHEIADALVHLLNPKGVAVLVSATHFCMMMRGVEKQQSTTVTKEYRGVFLDNAELRHDFISLGKA